MMFCILLACLCLFVTCGYCFCCLLWILEMGDCLLRSFTCVLCFLLFLICLDL